MNRRIIVILLLLTAAATLETAGQPPTAPPPPRAIPGITAVDTHPNACVSCHVDMPDIGIDARLSTVIGRLSVEVDAGLLEKAQATLGPDNKLAGRHPSVADALDAIPSTCIDCHEASSGKAPRFSQMIHSIHLTGGEKNHFLTIFQGECTLCHKLDAATGAWAVPSRSEK